MKKAFVVLFVIIVLLLIIIFAYRSCEARRKPVEEEVEEETTEAETTTEEEGENLDALYQSAFIKANTEFTCQILEIPELAEDEEKMKENLNTAYEKYGLPVDDDETMIKILDKYENDEAVINTIKENVKECAPLE